MDVKYQNSPENWVSNQSVLLYSSKEQSVKDWTHELHPILNKFDIFIAISFN